jgi:vacuolar-type H+-ATPase subunit F/Vma7
MPTEGSGRIAVVGPRAVVAAFGAAGLLSEPAEPGPGAAEAVERLIASGYEVIFFTEDLLTSLNALLERYRKTAVPCLVSLPVGGGHEAMARLREVVKRAIGADIFSSRPAAPGEGASDGQ